MTKQEFLDALGARLSEELSTVQVLGETQYYRGYIDGELKRGKSEEEILEELGDPVLIARTILESPHEEPVISSPTEAEDAYLEGEYQGEYQKTPEDVKREMEAAREAAADKYREARERAAVHQAEREAGMHVDNSSGGAGGSAGDEERVQGDVVGKGGIFKDANGDFNWSLLAFLLAAVMIVVAVIWVVGKVVSHLGPILLVIVAVLLITGTLRRHRGE